MQNVSADKKIGEWFDSTPRHAAQEIDTYIRRRFSDGWRSATRAAFRAQLGGTPPPNSLEVNMEHEVLIDVGSSVGAAHTNIDAAIDAMSARIDLAVCRRAESSLHADVLQKLEASLRDLGKSVVWLMHPEALDTFQELRRRAPFKLPGSARAADGMLGPNPFFVVHQLPYPNAYVLVKDGGKIYFPAPLDVRITREAGHLTIRVARKAIVSFDNEKSACEVVYAPAN